MSQPNPFQSPAVAESHEQDTAMAMVPIVPRPALLSKSSIAAIVWMTMLLLFAIVGTVLYHHAVFTPLSILLIPSAVWLGAGRGWAGVRMLVVAVLFFAFSRIGSTFIEEDIFDFSREMHGITLLTAALLIAIVDGVLCLAVRHRGNRKGPSIAQIMLALLGFLLLVPSVLETFMPPIYLLDLVVYPAQSYQVAYVIGAVIAGTSIPLLVRKHDLLKYRRVGLGLAVVSVMTVISLAVLTMEGLQNVILSPLISLTWQSGIALILYPVDYTLRIFGTSLVEIPMKPIASETTDA